ncbi:hypothetical protein E3N88_30567 [Mikania micrantha]|uniref:ARID domain-containing protein n=1 Tax=Mikania micrantha TaxID=192012 RepID=A0A5N6MMF8_9ASTR|nr:hypothetical protein E3N88_30567 [Mikania micrantha]
MAKNGKRIDLEHTNEKETSETMLKHFEEMELNDEKIQRMKINGKGKDPIGENESEEVGTIEEMVILLDLLAEMNTNTRGNAVVKSKFNKMVKWFNKYVIKKDDFWAPVMGGEEVDLYHLYMAVQLNGGKENVTKNSFWDFIATDMKMDSRNGFQLLLQYKEHLEMMH